MAKVAPGSSSPYPIVSATLVKGEPQVTVRELPLGQKVQAGARLSQLADAMSALTWSAVGVFPEAGLSQFVEDGPGVPPGRSYAAKAGSGDAFHARF